MKKLLVLVALVMFSVNANALTLNERISKVEASTTKQITRVQNQKRTSEEAKQIKIATLNQIKDAKINQLKQLDSLKASKAKTKATKSSKKSKK